MLDSSEEFPSFLGSIRPLSQCHDLRRKPFFKNKTGSVRGGKTTGIFEFKRKKVVQGKTNFLPGKIAEKR
jgi:hypothetical protein